MRKRKPHCSHVSHFILCDCQHEKMLHMDTPEAQESGHCTEKRCQCESFRPGYKYTQEQMAHESIPIEGKR